MDADISSADAIALDRIRTQIARDQAANLIAYRASHLSIIQGLTDWAKVEYAKLPPETAYDRRWAMTLAIADKYMSAGTATDPVLVLADAQKDAARLKAAIDEAMKV
jgi:hypothetical protein